MIKGFKILEFKDFEKDLTTYHREGAKAGIYLGFSNMDGFYSMKQDGVTDWTGLPQSGKTELLLECLFNASSFYGWKHLLLVPDIGDCIEIMAILIHKFTGETFDKKYPNYIDLKTAFNSCAWLLEHFHILEQVDIKAKITPVQFWEFAVEYKKEHGINTAVIDSWKDLHHDYENHGGSYAKYLSSVLPIRNRLSQQHNIHFHTVIHPKNPRRGKNNEILQPQTDDMEGGAQWNNSGKCIISVHRTTPTTTVADINILKVKPKVVGQRGMFCLEFDPTSSRYFQLSNIDGGTKIFATKKEAKQSPLQPSSMFNINEHTDQPPF